MAIIGGLIALAAFLWLLHRMMPALFASLLVLFVPVWLVGGFILDQLRRLFRPKQ